MTQQNPNPQVEEVGTSRSKNKRPRPFFIEYRRLQGWGRQKGEWTEWRVHGRYRTEAERDATLENMQRKHASIRWEYRAGGDE